MRVPEYRPDDQVWHEDFGIGVVLEILDLSGGRGCEIQFGIAGRRRINCDFLAPWLLIMREICW